MLLIRDIMFCKPGKVRPLVEKFVAMSKFGEKHGLPTFRVMTDLSSERFWMVVAEAEVDNLQAFEEAMSGRGMSDAARKEMEGIMKGYHDLVDEGRREIYRMEG